MKNRWSFDVAVEGYEESCRTMSEIMESYQQLKKNHNYAEAYKELLHAAESCHRPAVLELARFLVQTPQLDISHQKRYALAEKYYKKLLNLLDNSNTLTATISAELAQLYGFQGRPIAELGSLLMARRYGHHVEDFDLNRCKKVFRNLDVNSLCNDRYGCFLLGRELYLAGSKLCESFLMEACEVVGDLGGQAALLLADYYSEKEGLRHEANKYYLLAAQKGHPEVLVHRQEEKAGTIGRQSIHRGYAV